MIKVGFAFSSELNILYGVLQGSMLGPHLFNIDICDLFFIDTSSILQTLLMVPVFMNVVNTVMNR